MLRVVQRWLKKTPNYHSSLISNPSCSSFFYILGHYWTTFWHQKLFKNGRKNLNNSLGFFFLIPKPSNFGCQMLFSKGKKNSKYCLSFFFFQNWTTLSAENCSVMDEKTWNASWVQNWTWIMTSIFKKKIEQLLVLRNVRACVAWS
jgi:hypothetical protein